MGDPLTALGAAASVAQFVVIAVRVTGRVKDYCSSAKGAPEAFRQLSIQLPLLVEVCKEYGALPSTGDSTAVEDTVSECSRKADELDKLLARATTNETDSQPVRAKKAVVSMRLEKKVEESLSRLETLKTLLLLKIGLMTYAVLKPPATTTEKASCYCVPSGRLYKFFGRKGILDQIDKALKPGDRDPRVCVLQGMGGQGKTSLAMEYCKREMVTGHFRTILWVDANSLASVHRSFAHFAERLTDHRRVFPDPSACVDQVKTTLQTWATPWLVVFDNYDRPESLPGVLDYLPNCGNGAVLMTSRHSGLASIGHVIPVTGMDAIESIQLFLDRTGAAHNAQSVESAKSVVDTLGYLPLALDQSAAYIRSRKISSSEFLRHYKTRKLKVIDFVPALSTYKGIKITGSKEAEKPLSVFTTWEMSFDQIRHLSEVTDHDAVVHFLTTLAFFSNLDLRMDMFKAYFEANPVGSEWLQTFVDPDSGDWDDFAYQDIVSALEQLSLLQYEENHAHEETSDGRHRGVSLHPLVRDWIQLRIKPQQRRKHCTEALQILHNYVLTRSLDDSTFSHHARREVQSHLDAALECQTQYMLDWFVDDYDSLRNCLEAFVRFYFDQGKYTEAEEVCKKIVVGDEKVKGTTSEQYLSAQISLTDVYLQQGHYDMAEEKLLRVKDIDDLTALTDGVVKIHMTKNLGTVYMEQGRYLEAHETLTATLAQQQLSIAGNECDILDTKEKLAQVCRKQGEHQEAIKLYASALEGYKSQNEELRRLKCMVNLANTYRSQVLGVQAGDLYKSALDGLNERLGPDHPYTIKTKLYGGINCIALEEFDIAEISLRDVVTRSVSVLGPKHPDSFKSMMILGMLLHRRDNLTDAEPLYRATLEGREAILGLTNPYTLRTCECLASLLCTQDRFKEAETLALRATSAERRSSAPPTLAPSRSISHDSGISVASTVSTSSGLFPGLEALFSQAVDRSERTLNTAHRDRIDSYIALARVHEKQERYQDAKHYKQLANWGLQRAREQVKA